MINAEFSEDNQMLERMRAMQSVHGQLQASLSYRASHQVIGPKNRLVAAVDFPDETSEDYFHPNRSGLVCDAPLGLKY